jgi:transcriptional regulator with XRE-family HTH domain
VAVTLTSSRVRRLPLPGVSGQQRISSEVDAVLARVARLARLLLLDTFSQGVRGVHRISACVLATVAAAREQVPSGKDRDTASDRHQHCEHGPAPPYPYVASIDVGAIPASFHLWAQLSWAHLFMDGSIDGRLPCCTFIKRVTCESDAALRQTDGRDSSGGGNVKGTVSPVQSRRLARTLRRWREQAGYSVERAAEELLCGAGTVSRMETGGAAEPLRVKAALELYGAPPNLIAEMVEAAKQRRRRGVLRRPYYDFVRQTFAQYLDLEYEASELACFQSDIVHGLLQTEDYARALINSAAEVIAADDMEKFLRLRMERQERLRGDDPLVLRVILVEAALYTEVGGPAVLRAQLEHLITLHETANNIELRVLPFAAGGHPAVGCNYTVLGFPGAEGKAEPEVVYTENVVNFVLQDDKDEVDRFQHVYDRVWRMTLEPFASAELIRRRITTLAD